jgi:hypothetical protein
MSYIVRVIASADGSPNPHSGRYVVRWDPHSAFGTLKLISTVNPEEARRFFDAAEVHREWTQVSDVQVYRPDAQLNRPLTGITIEMVKLK